LRDAPFGVIEPGDEILDGDRGVVAGGHGSLHSGTRRGGHPTEISAWVADSWASPAWVVGLAVSRPIEITLFIACSLAFPV
jgi:hypothetical protein